MLQAICSIGCRAERTEKTASGSSVRSSFSGASDAPPTPLSAANQVSPGAGKPPPFAACERRLAAGR